MERGGSAAGTPTKGRPPNPGFPGLEVGRKRGDGVQSGLRFRSGNGQSRYKIWLTCRCGVEASHDPVFSANPWGKEIENITPLYRQVVSSALPRENNSWYPLVIYHSLCGIFGVFLTA